MKEEIQEQLVIKYLYGELAEEEEKEWIEFQEEFSDPSLQEDLAFFADLIVATELKGESQIKLHLQGLELNLQKERSSQISNTPIFDKIKKLAEYSLDELSALFAPVPHYQLRLAQAYRGNEIRLKQPQNEANIDSGILTFQFEQTTSEQLELRIENNRQGLLVDTHIPSGSLTFDLQLDESLFLAGRFYWKLTGSKETELGVFFVRKGLLQ